MLDIFYMKVRLYMQETEDDDTKAERRVERQGETRSRTEKREGGGRKEKIVIL